ncbi:hypothetical protein GQ54DRAFT_299373 [Martensiomyces pterosporus]|nr:hypothetical protein GQ54DRAFT_299373 [Martensiomyces pterosporus]
MSHSKRALEDHRMLCQRANVAAEILDTERTYVEGLGLIEKIFISPLLASAQQHNPILSRKEVRQLFANFPDIISLSRELLSQLEERLGSGADDAPWDPATGRIGDIFLRIAPFFKMYSLYLRNFRSALSDISRWLSTNPDFASFIQRANSSPECKGLSFQSYLLLPVQRIPRYKLLLEDLLKHTPAGHVDRQNISDALRTIEDVAAFVNENVQEHEMTLSIIEIQRTLGLKESLLIPGRRLIKVGPLMKICRKSHQQRQFYLFSDILLYSSTPAALIDDQSGHRRVPLEDCKVMEVPDTVDCRNQFTIISREKSFIVYTHTSLEKTKWIQALTQAITERRKARETLQMDSSLKRRIARARRSTMLQFPRVAENFDAPVWDPDESSEVCYICFREFTLFLRKHHCRACGKIVCNACSRKNIVFVGRTTTETKEGRGCDQCIARLFGREALESPPGTIHRLISKSRHSLDPSALVQSLSALAGGSNAMRQLPAEPVQAVPWADASLRTIGESETSRAYAPVADAADEGSTIHQPGSSGSLLGGGKESVRDKGSGDKDKVANSPARLGICYLPDASLDRHVRSGLNEHSNVGVSSSQSLEEKGAPSLDSQQYSSPAAQAYLPRSASLCRGASLSDLSSLPVSREPRAADCSLALAHKAAKCTSTGCTCDWESTPFSARSTLLYDPSSPSTTAASAHSPVSTLSHNRISLVSSSCSTIASEPSLKHTRMKLRHPLIFAMKEPSVPEPSKQETRPPGDQGRSDGGQYSSFLTVYEGHVSPALPVTSCLVSSAAPPKLTLAQAEATARRSRSDVNATLCSLCHGNFTVLDSQHQCSSCLSLVCSRCINVKPPPPLSQHPSTTDLQPTAQASNGSRILSMYTPSGYDLQAPGDMICDSCISCEKSRYRHHPGASLGNNREHRQQIYPYNA